MKILMESSEALFKHGEMIANNKARVIDGYFQLYIKKRPSWMPKSVYRFILQKVLVVAYFREQK